MLEGRDRQWVSANMGQSGRPCLWHLHMSVTMLRGEEANGVLGRGGPYHGCTWKVQSVYSEVLWKHRQGWGDVGKSCWLTARPSQSRAANLLDIDCRPCLGLSGLSHPTTPLTRDLLLSTPENRHINGVTCQDHSEVKWHSRAGIESRLPGPRAVL